MKTKVPLILELADRIEKDIARRRLKPGQQYQSTAETATMLGVSTTAANRALQVLVKRKVVERRQRKGTFVAHPSSEPVGSPLRRVHLLVYEGYLRSEGLLSDGIVVGMHDELPHSQMQFSFLPAEDEGRHVSTLINEAMKSPEAEGVVLVRTSLSVQRQLAQSGMPAVVFGSLHPSVPRMPHIDRDHTLAGRLMVQWLIDRGCRRIVLLMRDRMFRGDHELLDSVQQTMAEKGLKMSSLASRFLPPDVDAIRSAVAELLPEVDERIGIICRSEPLARGAEAALRAAKKRPGTDAAIVVSDIYRKSSDAPPAWPYVRATLSPEEIGHHIGRMLAQQARQEPVVPDVEVIGVELVEPQA